MILYLELCKNPSKTSVTQIIDDESSINLVQKIYMLSLLIQIMSASQTFSPLSHSINVLDLPETQAAYIGS